MGISQNLILVRGVSLAAWPCLRVLYRPVGAENICHQAVLMNHASGAVAPLDPELIQVGDAIGQRAQRRGLVQGSVRPVVPLQNIVVVSDLRVHRVLQAARWYSLMTPPSTFRHRTGAPSGTRTGSSQPGGRWVRHWGGPCPL